MSHVVGTKGIRSLDEAKAHERRLEGCCMEDTNGSDGKFYSFALEFLEKLT